MNELKTCFKLVEYDLAGLFHYIGIGDDPPSKYVPAIRARFGDSKWRAMHELLALPGGWEQMDYLSFLEARRKLMAAIIRRGFDTLA
jgi:hypothetical protein